MSHRLRYLPNALSLLRLLLTIPLIWAILEGDYILLLELLLLAAITDIADGSLARGLDARTELGAILDPLADKVLLSFGFLALAWVELVPIYLAALMFMRDLVIGVGAGAYRRRHGDFKVFPTFMGKLSTVCVFSYSCCLIAGQAAGWSLDPRIWWATELLCSALLVASGIHYVYLGYKGRFEVCTGENEGKTSAT